MKDEIFVNAAAANQRRKGGAAKKSSSCYWDGGGKYQEDFDRLVEGLPSVGMANTGEIGICGIVSMRVFGTVIYVYVYESPSFFLFVPAAGEIIRAANKVS